MESLESLRFANEKLMERISELERALEDKPQLQWQNTFTQQAAKVVETECDKFSIKTLAKTAPKDLTQETADELIGLLGMALSNIAIALPSPSAEVLKATGEILKCEPSKDAITRTSQGKCVAREINALFLNNPTASWLDFWVIAEKYEDIKTSYWKELSVEQKELIKTLKTQYDNLSLQQETRPELPSKEIQINSIVRICDPYTFGYLKHFIVTEIMREAIIAKWLETPSDHLEFRRFQMSELEVVELS